MIELSVERKSFATGVRRENGVSSAKLGLFDAVLHLYASPIATGR